jgi:hypothetical protein
MNATELCGEYAVTSMILSCLEILWYGFGCFNFIFPIFTYLIAGLLQTDTANI